MGKSIEIKLARRLAERLLRKVNTNFVNSKGECFETESEITTNENLVNKWDVVEIYYRGNYWHISED